MAKYEGMTIEELEGIIREVTEVLNSKKEAELAELYARIEKLGGVVPGKGKPRATEGVKDGRAAPKPTHRDPATGQTWASRGVKPKWLQAYIDQGKDPDEFRIKE